MAVPNLATISAVADDEARGQEIRRRREFLGLTQADLAARVGVVEQTIRNIEKGRNSRNLGDVLAKLNELERSPTPRTASGPVSDSPMLQALTAVIGDDEVYDLRVRMIRGVRVVEFIAKGRHTSDDEVAAVIAEIRRPDGM